MYMYLFNILLIEVLLCRYKGIVLYVCTDVPGVPEAVGGHGLQAALHRQDQQGPSQSQENTQENRSGMAIIVIS